MDVCIDCSGSMDSSTVSVLAQGFVGPNARIAITGVRPRCQLFSVKNQLSRFSVDRRRRTRSRRLQVVLRAEPRCRPMPICQTRILSLLPTWNSTRTCRCHRPMTLLLHSRDGSSILNHGSQPLKSDAFALVSRHNPRNIL